MLSKLLKYYLLACGLVLHLGVLAGFVYALDHYALTPRQFFIKASEKAGIDSPWLLSVLEAEPRYSEHTLDGQLKAGHPRLLLPELKGLDSAARLAFFAERDARYQAYDIAPPVASCQATHLSALTLCWLLTDNRTSHDRAIQKLLDFKAQTPDASATYGNAWQLALNYDLLGLSSRLSAGQRQQIENKLENALLDYLRLLDEDSASLWHGRLTLSSNAWLCALMLSPDNAKRRDLISRAQGHFLDSVQAVALTEAWPEGYNYWINNRAFYFVLAATGYLNALENSQHSAQLKQLLERIGLWHLYATRPDNRIQGYGDEGSRLDLKDETRRVIDLIASTTGNRTLAAYSRYLQNLHGKASYYRGYRWAYPLFNNPQLATHNATDHVGQVAAHLPTSALFGRQASNALYIRSDWQPQATYITYRAGHSFTHHGHYDAGHFTLFKGAPLAVNSSPYGKFTGPNRLNYALRTIAKNSLLIQRPDETVRPNRFFTDNVAGGGQRITLPTGSAIQSTRHWRDNLYQGQHLAAAELQQFATTKDFTYIQSDLTAAYNNTDYDENGAGGKVEQVTRALFYLAEEDVLLVQDHIQSTDPAFRTKWLLHSTHKPDIDQAVVKKGQPDNGILQSQVNQLVIHNQNSYLQVQALLPRQTTTRLIGGRDFRYYVETDGDDSDLDGHNFNAGVTEAPWFEQADWRTEISPRRQTTVTRFLMALTPGIGQPQPLQTRHLKTDSEAHYGAVVAGTAVIFSENRRGRFEATVPSGVRRLYLVGPTVAPRRLVLNGQKLQSAQGENGVTRYDFPAAASAQALSIEL